MQLRFVSHSCIVIEAPGAVILCDPWLSGEVFNHGWQLAPPPLPLDDGELAAVTHLFISHEHPDHMGNANLFPHATWLLNPREQAYAVTYEGHNGEPPALLSASARGCFFPCSSTSLTTACWEPKVTG